MTWARGAGQGARISGAVVDQHFVEVSGDIFCGSEYKRIVFIKGCSKIFVQLFLKSWPTGRAAGGIKAREGKVVFGGAEVVVGGQTAAGCFGSRICFFLSWLFPVSLPSIWWD